MSELAKREFYKWVQSIKSQQLTPFEITYINILINNFDEVYSVGTASGNRAKLIANLINDKHLKNDSNIIDTSLDQETNMRIKRLEKLIIEHFRGFCEKVTFQFENQYTFFHGPNGSGKSSFCEALEYSLLGMIEEAETRNIPIQKYILHAGEQQANQPSLMCLYEDGNINLSMKSYDAYRFAFLEKNRIDKFSHMSATTEKNQSERIAALFGLTEFSTFIRNFTDTFDDRYIKLTKKLYDEYQLKIENNKKNESIQMKLEEEKEELLKQIQTNINNLNNSDINSLQDAIEFLYAPEIGLIHQLTEKKAKVDIPLIKNLNIKQIKDLIISLCNNIEQIRKLNSELISDVHSVNLLNLYKSIQEIKKDYTALVCPACQTPLVNVIENPFHYADNQVQKLSNIENIKNIVDNNANTALSTLVLLKSKIKDNINIVSIFNLDLDFFENSYIDKTDFVTLSEKAFEVFDCLNKTIIKLSNEQECETKIIKHNNLAIENNKIAENELITYKKIYENLIQLKAKLDTNIETILRNKNDITEFDIEYMKKIEDEQNVIDFNQNMVKAYYNVNQWLVCYMIGLPAKLSENLSSKVTEYYNIINEGDAEFEKVEYFKLPITSSDKIIVKFNDCQESDALLVLSEGHIRALGLSILLAKAVQEEQTFIIFDDIVNAIDDDHRNGVAELLIKCTDFEKMQFILTCHGDQFLTNLEDKMSNNLKYSRYMFMPADSLSKRGIVIKYQDAKIPLKLAREKFNENELRDSASKCRQATECITSKLWSKLTNEIQCSISVTMRSPKAIPDLHSIVEGLIKATKPEKLLEADTINQCLIKLKRNYNWLLLNKGTHFDVDQTEFNRNEIKELLELLELFDNEVKEMKIINSLKIKI